MFFRLTASMVAAAAVAVAAAQSVAAQAPANDTVKGAALLTEARNALGGEDKIAAIKRLQVSGTSKRAQGGQTLEGDLTLFVELPDKYKSVEEISLPGGALSVTRTQALVSGEIWDQQEGGNVPGGFRGGFGGGGRGGDGGFRGGGGQGGNAGGARGAIAGLLGGDQQNGAQTGPTPEQQERIKQQQLRNRQGEFAHYLLAFLMTTTDPVAWIGTAQSPDGTADVLEIKSADGTATRLFLESATHMPLMLTYQGPAPRQGGGNRGGGRRGGGDNPGGGQGGIQGRGQGGDQGAAGAAPQGAPGGGRANLTPEQIAAIQAARAGAQQQATIEMHLGDYKVVNGVKLPHQITTGTNGQTQQEIDIKNYKINPTFKANTFIQPKS